MNDLRKRFWAGALAAAALTSTHAVVVRGEEPAPAGWEIHLDEGGKPVVPDPAESSPPSLEGHDAAQQAMPEVQVAPGGGEMVILDDRFNRNSVGHREGDEVRIGCKRQGAVGAPVRKGE
jgi:hypothetical protein